MRLIFLGRNSFELYAIQYELIGSAMPRLDFGVIFENFATEKNLRQRKTNEDYCEEPDNPHGMNCFLKICLRFVLYVPPRIELKLMYIDDVNQGLELIQRLILYLPELSLLPSARKISSHLRLTQYLFNRMWAVSAI